jgi:hypothetical protein
MSSPKSQSPEAGQGLRPSIPAMAITIEVEGGLRVRLDYDPVLQAALPLELRQSLFRAYVPCTKVSILTQRGSHSFADVITWAMALLFSYGTCREDWPADLRPAAQRAEARAHADEHD